MTIKKMTRGGLLGVAKYTGADLKRDHIDRSMSARINRAAYTNSHAPSGITPRA